MANGMEIASLFARVGADVGDFEKGMGKVKDNLTSTQKGFGSFEKAATLGFRAIGVAAVAAFAGVGAAIVGSIKSAANFEQGIADIGAVMSLTDKEAEKLESHISELGLDPTLKVSATEASDAIMALGTAGLTLDEIMSGGSRSVVEMSNATGGPMADSASLLTDVMSQFNITAEESGRIVDQVTGLTVASKFGFNDVSLAMAQAGGVAGSTGMEFEDFAAILGVTAANFSSGSDAGTSLKTMLTTLVPKSQAAEDAMSALGLIQVDYASMAEYLSGVLGEQVTPSIDGVYEAFKRTSVGAAAAEEGNEALAKAFTGLKAQYSENQFFDDTTGAMKSAEEIAGILTEAFAGLSEEQRIEAASTIFGNDAMRTAFGLIQAGTPGITKMKEEIAAVDAGSIAAKRMDTFAGAMEIASGVIETLSIQIGQKFLPVLRPLVEKFSELAQTYGPMVIEFFGNIADRISAFIGGFMAVTPVIGEGNTALETLGVTSEKASRIIETLGASTEGVNHVLNIMAEKTKVVTDTATSWWERMLQVGNVIKLVSDHVRLAIKPITDAIGKWVGWQDVLLAVGILLGGAMLTAIGGFIAAMSPVILLVAKVTAVIALLKAAWEINFLEIRSITENVLDSIAGWLQTYTSLWRGSWGKTLDYFLTHSNEVWNEIVHFVKSKIHDMVRETKHAISVWVDGIIDRVDRFVTNTKSDLGENGWLGWIKRYFNEAKEWAIEKWQALVEWFQRHTDNLINIGRDIIGGLRKGMETAWDTLMRWWDSVWGKDLTKTVKVEMKTNSPSKVMEQLGAWTMQGFGIGAEKMLPYVESVMAAIPTASMNAGNNAGEYAYAGVPSGSADSSPEVALLQRNNDLLVRLINVLENKNMNVTVNGGGGESITAYNALESGLRRGV